MVSESEMRLVMGKFATGVVVVTTLDIIGRPHFMTANSLISVSLLPPLILISVGHERNSFKFLKETGRFGISILRSDQKAIALQSSLSEKNDGDIASVPYDLDSHNMPMISGCLGFLECLVEDQHIYGDHSVFIGLVKKTKIYSGSPLLFFESKWAEIAGE